MTDCRPSALNKDVTDSLKCQILPSQPWMFVSSPIRCSSMSDFSCRHNSPHISTRSVESTLAQFSKTQRHGENEDPNEHSISSLRLTILSHRALLDALSSWWIAFKAILIPTTTIQDLIFMRGNTREHLKQLGIEDLMIVTCPRENPFTRVEIGPYLWTDNGFHKVLRFFEDAQGAFLSSIR